MKVTPTALPEVLILEPRVFGDARGFFTESYNARVFAEATGLHDVEFVQDNHSRSGQGVLRGLHYQLQQPQGKLVRVVRGAVFDVAVDMRRHSPRFGRWVGVELSEHNHRQLWLPEGFAHGFLVLSDQADFVIGIAWPLAQAGIQAPTLSEKDRAAPLLAAADCFEA